MPLRVSPITMIIPKNDGNEDPKGFANPSRKKKTARQAVCTAVRTVLHHVDSVILADYKCSGMRIGIFIYIGIRAHFLVLRIPLLKKLFRRLFP